MRSEGLVLPHEAEFVALWILVNDLGAQLAHRIIGDTCVGAATVAIVAAMAHAEAADSLVAAKLHTHTFFWAFVRSAAGNDAVAAWLCGVAQAAPVHSAFESVFTLVAQLWSAARGYKPKKDASKTYGPTHIGAQDTHRTLKEQVRTGGGQIWRYQLGPR